MLHFRKITLENFGPYKGIQEIDLTDQSGVTIFWGNNGRGKTTLLNAFRYALFGEIQKRTGVLNHLSEMINKEAFEEGQYGFSVTLDMINRDTEGDAETNTDDVTDDNVENVYKLKRQYCLRKGIKSPTKELDYESVVTLRKNDVILSSDDRDHELNIIMPVQVARFFLFDAELLQEYEELLEINSQAGTEIKQSIEQILGVPVLINSVIDIKECLDVYENEKQKAISKSENSKKLGDDLEQINSKITEHQDILDEKNDEFHEAIEKRRQLEKKMAETEQLQKWITQREEAIKEKEKEEEELNKVQAEITELMGDAWKGMLLTTIRDITNSLDEQIQELENKKREGIIAEYFNNEIRSAIDERRCPICEQDISDEIIQKLNDRIEKSKINFSGITEPERQKLDELRSQKKAIEAFSSNASDVKDKVSQLEERKDVLHVSINDRSQKIDELQDNLSDYRADINEASIISLMKEYSEVDHQCKELDNGIEAESKILEEYSAHKRSVSSQIDKIENSGAYKFACKKYDICENIYKIFDEGKTLYREQLKSKVEKDATDIFTKLSGDKGYTALKINENYGLEIVLQSGDTVPGRSSGYEHIVALCLIGALHKNAPLTGPIIIDSPFGRLDPVHKTNIIQVLPEMAEQTILLVYTGEIDEQKVRENLGNHLLHEFTMQYVSSLNTRIEKGGNCG